MKKIYFLLVLCFFAFKSYAVDYISASSTGDWYTPSMWSQEVVPDPATLQNTFKITISVGAEVRHTGNVTLDAKGNLIINGLLIIDGDLNITNSSGNEIIINDGGVLMITGDFNSGQNNTSVSSGGFMIVGGDYNHTGTGTSSIENPGNIYTLGTANSGLVDQGQINEGEDALKENSYLYNLVLEKLPSVLPVNLLYFTATPQKSAVKLDWASSKAWDFSHYELERSADGKNFEYLASIDAEENTDWVVNYSFEDLQPLSGISYYRLKAVDIDGSFEYKGIEVVQFAAAMSLKAFPNPSSNGFLNILTDKGADARVSLKDNSGRTVYAGTMQNAAKTIDTSSLQPGLYVLIVEGAGAARQTQVIIQ